MIDCFIKIQNPTVLFKKAIIIILFACFNLNTLSGRNQLQLVFSNLPATSFIAVTRLELDNRCIFVWIVSKIIVVQ